MTRPPSELLGRTPAHAGVRRLDRPLLRPDQAAELLSVNANWFDEVWWHRRVTSASSLWERDPTFTGAVAVGDSVSPQRGARFLGRMRHAVCGAVDAGDVPASSVVTGVKANGRS